MSRPLKEVVLDLSSLPYVDRIRWRRNSFDGLGPFGGGWITKFSVLIGSSRIVIECWRWSISIYFSPESTE